MTSLRHQLRGRRQANPGRAPLLSVRQGMKARLALGSDKQTQAIVAAYQQVGREP